MRANLRAAAACVILGLGITLGACAAPGPLQLYPGDPRPMAQIASVTLPEQLEIVSVNGARVSGGSGPLRRGELTLHLAPGAHELLVFYRETWSVGDNDEILRSDPALFLVEAAAGGSYRIDFDRPRDYSAAQALSAGFRGWTEDLRSGERTPSSASGRADAQGDSSLAEMQRLWQQATPQTRRAFGEWLRTRDDAAAP